MLTGTDRSVVDRRGKGSWEQSTGASYARMIPTLSAHHHYHQQQQQQQQQQQLSHKTDIIDDRDTVCNSTVA